MNTKRINFSLNESDIKKLDELSRTLKKTRSKTLRLMIYTADIKKLEELKKLIYPN